MKKLATAAVALACLSVPAFAATDTLGTIPSDSMTVTDWYKQPVYDPNKSEIGKIDDVLLDKSGRVTALIIGVGGFLGAGEKDVAVAYDSVQATKKNNSWYLVLDATKDSLKSAQGYKYDSSTTTWTAQK